jgi:hypothetical protein
MTKYFFIIIAVIIIIYASLKINNIREAINYNILKMPVYSNLPSEYTSTDYMGETKMKGDILNEQIAEEMCPVGTYIKNLEVGSDGENINYILGTCSDGQQLEILGKNNNAKNIKNISKQYGIEKLNVKYDDSFIQKIEKEGSGILNTIGKTISCPENNIIVGYRGRAEDKIKHLQFVCCHKDAEKDIPKTHIKCGNEGEVCKFNRNEQFIYYGIPGKKVIKINKKKLKSDKFTCYPKNYFPKNKTEVLPIDDILKRELGSDIGEEKKGCYLEKPNYKLEQELWNKEKKRGYRLYGAWSNI